MRLAVKNRNALRWVMRLVGVALAVMLYASVDFATTFRLLANVNQSWLVGAIGLTALATTVRCGRWYFLLAHFGSRAPFRNVLVYHLIGIFFGAVTPGRLGELAKFTYVRNEDGSMSGRYLLSVMIDKLWDAMGLFPLIIIAVLMLLLSPIGAEVPFLQAAVLSGAAFVVTGLLWASRNVVLRAVEQVAQRIGTKAIGAKIAAVRECLDSFSAIEMAASWLLSLLSWGFYVVIFVVVARGLGIELPFMEIALSAFLAAIAVVLPISVAGVGTRDAALVYAFSLFGESAGAALSLSMIILFLNLCVSATGAGLYFVHQREVARKAAENQ